MLTYHQQSPVTITCGQFHKRYLSHQLNLVQNCLTKVALKSTRGQWFKQGNDIFTILPLTEPGDATSQTISCLTTGLLCWEYLVVDCDISVDNIYIFFNYFFLPGNIQQGQIRYPAMNNYATAQNYMAQQMPGGAYLDLARAIYQQVGYLQQGKVTDVFKYNFQIWYYS